MWTEGGLQTLKIKWLNIEGVIPIRPGKELISTIFYAETDKSIGRIYFDNFGLFRNLASDKTLGNNVIYLPVGAGTTELLVYGAVWDSFIATAHLVPKQEIIGDDPPLQLLLRNMETDEVICTKTFAVGIDAPMNEVTEFGPTDEDAREISEGQSVRFEVSGGSIPEILLIIEWNQS